MATQIDWSAFQVVDKIDPEDLIYFLKVNRNQKNAGGKVISFSDFKFLLSTLGVQTVTGNLVNNTNPQYPVINQSVSTDANNSAILGTDGLVYVPPIPPAPIQSVTGNLVDNTDPANPIIDQSVSADVNNDAILGTDNLLFVPQRVQSVTGDSVDNTDPLNPIVKSIANLSLYSTTAASDIVGYSKLVVNITDPDYNTIPVDVPTGAITSTGQLLASLSSSPGIFIGNPGVITVSTVGEIRRTSGSGTAEFYFEVYHRNSLGVETLIATSNLTPPVNTVAYIQFQASALLNNGLFTLTDRLVIKYYANRVPGGSNPDYDFLFGGTNPVRTLFPVPSSVIGDLPIAIGVTTVDGGNNGEVLRVTSGKVGQSELKTINTNSIFGTGDIAITPASIGAYPDTNPSNFINALQAANAAPYNGKIEVTVTSNNITLALKTLAGADPSASSPVYVNINGTIRSVTAALSVTRNAGTDWFGNGLNFETDYFAYLGYNATDGLVIGFAQIIGERYGNFSATTTAWNYIAVSTTTNAAANDAYVVIGRFAATLGVTASFNWSVPTYTPENLIQYPIYESRWIFIADTAGTINASTIVGWSSFISRRIQYKVSYNTVMVIYQFLGTSNSTLVNFTVPIFALSGTYEYNRSNLRYNNGVPLASALVTFDFGSNIIRFWNGDSDVNTWTASGVKQVAGQLFYRYR